MPKKDFRTKKGKKLDLPLFFPDATRAVLKSLDSRDIQESGTPGVLVNTYHLLVELGSDLFQQFNGVSQFMNWPGAIISDSGGFQVMSLAKKQSRHKAVCDEGVFLKGRNGQKKLFTPEDSISFQMKLKTDLMVVLDDFTPPGCSQWEAAATVERTVLWARRSKAEFKKQCRRQGLTKEEKPYLVGVVQGGQFPDLRTDCAQKLVEIGFDGFGYGGWPLDDKGQFDYRSAEIIAANTPKDYFLYGLGIGKPEDIVGCAKLGYQLFDCVLPTRDARHRRLYVFRADSMDEIDLDRPPFYDFLPINKAEFKNDDQPISSACDCYTCQNYSRAYLHYLFKIKETTAYRLASIHNLRFYSLLMEKIRKFV